MRKYRPYGKVYKEILFSDSLTWKGKIVYAVLTIYVNKEGKCWPSHNTLAKKLNVSRATIKRGITELIKAKIIIQEKNIGRNNSYQFNKILPYYFLPDNMSQRDNYGTVRHTN